jgi:pimeloyl-ACP methyl ester carboxylesterase
MVPPPSSAPTPITIEARGLAFPALSSGTGSSGTGELVLCLHGFPDNPRSFRHQLPAFARAGYRAVAVTLRGYAPTCLSAREHCHTLEVARDLVAIVQALGATRAHLVGHDWGAMAAYVAAALSPDTWKSVCTIAVPHPLALLAALPHVPNQLHLFWYMAFFQLPFVERAIRARNFALLVKLWRDWSPGFEPPADEREAMKHTFGASGVLEAALGYYRNLLAFDSSSTRATRALLKGTRIEPPTLAITGARDGCIDTRTYDYAMDERYFRKVLVERVENAGHFVHQETPEQVNLLMLDWFAQHA